MRAKLDILHKVVQQRGIKMGVILDATSDTFALGSNINMVLNQLFLQYCYERPACVGLFPFVGGLWADITAEAQVFRSLNAMADAVKTQIWTHTAAVAPATGCSNGSLLRLPDCSIGSGVCNAVMRLVTGERTGKNASVPKSILPARPITMALGDVWEEAGVCRELVNAWGNKDGVCCSGESTACWKEVGACSKSRVVECAVANYAEHCNSSHVNWTCCMPNTRLKSDEGDVSRQLVHKFQFTIYSCDTALEPTYIWGQRFQRCPNRPPKSLCGSPTATMSATTPVQTHSGRVLSVQKLRKPTLTSFRLAIAQSQWRDSPLCIQFKSGPSLCHVAYKLSMSLPILAYEGLGWTIGEK